MQTTNGNSFSDVLSNYKDGSNSPTEGFKGSENLQISQDGTVTAIKPGDATIEAKIPGLAAKSGFLVHKSTWPSWVLCRWFYQLGYRCSCWSIRINFASFTIIIWTGDAC